MDISVESTDNGACVTVMVHGRFDYRSYDSFKSIFSLLERSEIISVDLSDTNYLDSSALGMLIMLRERFGGVAEILLKSPAPNVARVLEIANFDKLFAIELTPGG